MSKIRTENLQVGMVVGEEVKSFIGDILIQPGTKLTETLIKALKMWGIEEVVVEGVEQITAEPESQPQMSSSPAAPPLPVDLYRFKHTDRSHPLILKLEALIPLFNLDEEFLDD